MVQSAKAGVAVVQTRAARVEQAAEAVRVVAEVVEVLVECLGERVLGFSRTNRP